MNKRTLFIQPQNKKSKIALIEATIELKKVPTWFLGVCYVIRFNSVEKWNKKISHSFHVLYKKTLDKKDIPKSFHIYFTPKHEWMGIVKENWIGTQVGFSVKLTDLPD